jgi:hypothetical protein
MPNRFALLRAWPLTSILVLLGLVLWPLWRSLGANAGQVVYLLDDPYIHLAIAKNLRETGIWGISVGVFSSASSSPLWTSLLAAISWLGKGELWPLWLNLLFAICFLVWAKQKLLIAPQRSVAYAAEASLMLGILACAMPAVILCGLEHTLHLFLMALALEGLARDIARPSPQDGEDRKGISDSPQDGEDRKNLAKGDLPLWRLWGVAVVGAVLARYESLFLVGVVGLIFLWQRRWRRAISLGIFAGLPVLAFGLFSVLQGGHLLPNPILLKGATASVFSSRGASLLLERLLDNLGQAPEVFSLMIMALLLIVLLKHKEAASCNERAFLRWGLGIFCATAAMHLFLARTGWFYRYEAYLLAIGFFWVLRSAFVFLNAVQPQFFSRWVVLFLVGLVILFGQRATSAQSEILPNLQGIYRQPYQVASFLEQYQPNASIVLIDVGLVAYKTRAQITDLAGLGDQKITVLKRRQLLNQENLAILLKERKTRIAILYNQSPPLGFCPVAFLRQEPKLCCASDTLTFSVPNRQAYDDLAAALRRFAPHLPSGAVLSWPSASERQKCSFLK